MMAEPLFETAIWGMLQYYGVISLADLFLVCNRCGLFQLTEYKVFLNRVQKELQNGGNMFFYKKLICHRDVSNPMMIRDVQKSMVAGEYKVFPLEEYLQAGTAEFVWGKALQGLEDFLQSCGPLPKQELHQEVIRLWLELNNMSELVLLTDQCAENVRLLWTPQSPEYMNLLAKIYAVAQAMPRWCCKGYSYEELAEVETVQKGKNYLC